MTFELAREILADYLRLGIEGEDCRVAAWGCENDEVFVLAFDNTLGSDDDEDSDEEDDDYLVDDPDDKLDGWGTPEDLRAVREHMQLVPAWMGSMEGSHQGSPDGGQSHRTNALGDPCITRRTGGPEPAPRWGCSVRLVHYSGRICDMPRPRSQATELDDFLEWLGRIPREDGGLSRVCAWPFPKSVSFKAVPAARSVQRPAHPAWAGGRVARTSAVAAVDRTGCNENGPDSGRS